MPTITPVEVHFFIDEKDSRYFLAVKVFGCRHWGVL